MERNLLLLGVRLLARPYLAVLPLVLFCAFLFGSGLVSVSRELISNWSMIYLSLTVILIVVCGVVGERTSGWSGRVSGVVYAAVPVGRLKRHIYLCLCASFLVVITMTLEKYVFGALSTIGDFNATRAQVFAEQDANIFSHMTPFLLPFAFIGPCLGILFYEDLPVGCRTLGISAGLLAVGWSAVLSAGRYYLVALVLLMGWCCLHRRIFGRPLLPGGRGFKVALLVGGLGLATGTAVLSYQRSAQLDEGSFALVLFSPLVRVDDSVVKVLADVDPVTRDGLVEMLTFWTTPVVAFDRLFDVWSLPPDYSEALSPVFYRRLAEARLVPQPLEKKRELESIADLFGFYTGTWTTAAFDMMISFGRLGGLVVVSLMAFGAGRLYAQTISSGAAVPMMLSGILWLFFFFWLQRSLFHEAIFEYPMWFLAFWWLVARLSQPGIARKNAPAHG